MSNFDLITQDWFEGNAPPEFSLTNTMFSINVNNKIVTHIYRKNGKSTSDFICIPLYPVVEWIARNWWRLFFECNQRQNSEGYQYCHNLQYAGEGYFLPNLLLTPEMDVMKFRWSPRSINQDSLSFLGDGNESVNFQAVYREIERFVQCVIERLRTNDIKNTSLQRDWHAILNSRRNKEEKQFCIACAQLGYDPYCVPEEIADNIISSNELLKEELSIGEYFNAVSPDSLKETTQWLSDITKIMKIKSKSVKILQEARELLSDCNIPAGTPAWERGYFEAKMIRSQFFKTQKSLNSLRDMIDEVSFFEEIPKKFCSALVGNTENSNPVFLHSPRANNFLYGRMFAEYLGISTNKVNLVTKVSTPNQKRCRAFSAELFAPAESLREDLKGCNRVYDDDISELAEKYDIDSLAIKHQIENHNIATVM